MNPKIYNVILKSLEKWSVVTMTEYSQYEDRNCNDGGAYSFTQCYEKTENGMWKLSFYTSSSFDYCPCCGSFHNGECSCDGNHQQYATKEVARFLESNWEDPEIEIEIII
jgi:hypothetical protein